jgi:hypothetical protein
MIGQQAIAFDQSLHVLKKAFKASASSTSGATLPICEYTCASIEPPKRLAPAPKSTKLIGFLQPDRATAASGFYAHQTTGRKASNNQR